MKFDASVSSFLLAFVGSLSGWIAWWVARRQQLVQKAVSEAEKSVNEKRDFDHLVRNQSEISKNIAYGFEDLEDRIDAIANELREIKAYLIRKVVDKEN
ncbi:hypothetical protein [Nostoc sp. NMS8]|uniref:hypothetical protein n=1 Tax=Nostoc sp. NMS8 TaxID=2815392 RepID=UPI0025D295B7|nr:hypothetical protein [Nostoc sp. NMS8]MBN3957510.1 hypothetical protein [Nostoc sp. NMS8]